MSTQVDEKHPVIRGLRWILANRKKPGKDELHSETSLSLLAGLAKSYVNQVLAGRINASNLQADTLEKLATAGRVRVEWLQHGREPRDLDAPDRVVEYDDPYPSRAQIVTIARGWGVKDTVLDALKQARLDAPTGATAGDPGIAHWKRLLRELVQIDAEGLSGIDDGPERGKPKIPPRRR